MGVPLGHRCRTGRPQAGADSRSRAHELMMRVAIIGYPGAGKTTLAYVLAARLGVQRTSGLAEATVALSSSGSSLVLDASPATIEELHQLDAGSPAGTAIDQILFLDASPKVLFRRLSQMAHAGVNASLEGDRMLRPPHLEGLCRYLELSGRLITVDADGSRTEVTAGVFEALGLTIGSQ